jgi:hypothetical protein
VQIKVLQATAQMEAAMQHIRNTTLASKIPGQAGSPIESPPPVTSGVSAASEMSGLHPMSPASNFSSSFANYLRAQQENPEMMYAMNQTVYKSSGIVVSSLL